MLDKPKVPVVAVVAFTSAPPISITRATLSALRLTVLPVAVTVPEMSMRSAVRLTPPVAVTSAVALMVRMLLSPPARNVAVLVPASTALAPPGLVMVRLPAVAVNVIAPLVLDTPSMPSALPTIKLLALVN